jgi:hypothetical protein
MGRNNSGGNGGKGGDQSKANQDNHGNQLNPNNDAYWQSRGEKDRPDDWDQEED